jgi:transposase
VEVEVWACDEHRIGLQPVLRRVWAPQGQRPVVEVQPRYEWSYLHGFVHPASGRTFWLLTPWISIAAFGVVLHEFAQFSGAGVVNAAGVTKRILLVLDQAGWHTSRQLVVPEGIELVFLPPYSPQLQPAERLWPLSNEAICNRRFASIEELEEAQAQRCRQLSAQPELIRSHTGFHWWPTTSHSLTT